MMITLVNSDDGDLAGYLENDVHSDYLEDVEQTPVPPSTWNEKVGCAFFYLLRLRAPCIDG